MIAVLVSGGKDSTATLLLALERHRKEEVLPLFTVAIPHLAGMTATPLLR